MFRRSSRALLWSLTVCAAFVGGVAYEHFGREAKAQSGGISTLYVPPGGLVFRSMDGKPLARISEGSHGGALELYDDRHEVSLRMQGARTPVLAHENPYTVDDRDPWTVGAPTTPPGY